WRVLCGPRPDAAVVPTQATAACISGPLQCLRSRLGGPTFGIEVKGEEILRFEAHGARRHWHKGGYDNLGAGGSHQDFPEGVGETASQFAWSLRYLRAHAQELLTEAGYPTMESALEFWRPVLCVGDICACSISHGRTDRPCNARTTRPGAAAPDGQL